MLSQENTLDTKRHDPDDVLQNTDALVNLLDTLLLTVSETSEAAVRGKEPEMWEAGTYLLGGDQATHRRMGVVLAISAALQTPGAMDAAVTLLRDRLADGLPVTWADQQVCISNGVEAHHAEE